MNLKEAFRYEKYLETLADKAMDCLGRRSRALKTTKLHKRSVANPEATDITEEQEPDSFPYLNDDVIKFLLWLIDEKEKLMLAVSKAKAECGIDIDASICTNRLRQNAAISIKMMLANFKPSKTIERGSDYKFNAEGNQVPYVYEVEATSVENFDREKDRSCARQLSTKADEVSAEIDAAIINTNVNYVPPFDVNDTFEDAAEIFFLLS